MQPSWGSREINEDLLDKDKNGHMPSFGVVHERNQAINKNEEMSMERRSTQKLSRRKRSPPKDGKLLIER